MDRLNFRHLRYFWAVAHDGNLTRTADRLNLSQSALSVQIRKLETMLGHDLFERRGRQLHLTEAGRIVLDHADAIFAAGEELLDTLKGTGRARRMLRVGALATLSRNFQIRFLRPLLGRADVEVVLRSGSPGDLLPALSALSLDVVLLNRPPQAGPPERFVVHQLAAQPVSLVGLPGLAPAPLETLVAQHPLLLPGPDSGLRAAFDALLDGRGLSPSIAAEVDDMAMLRLLVREGAGLAVLPPIVVTDELAAGELVEAARLPGLAETFYAVTVTRRFPNPLARELIAAARADGRESLRNSKDPPETA